MNTGIDKGMGKLRRPMRRHSELTNGIRKRLHRRYLTEEEHEQVHRLTPNQETPHAH